MGRDSFGSFFYFVSYEYLKYKLTPKDSSGPGVFGTLFAGGMAGKINLIKNMYIIIIIIRNYELGCCSSYRYIKN